MDQWSILVCDRGFVLAGIVRPGGPDPLRVIVGRLAARLQGEATRLLAMDEALAFPAEIQAEQGQAEQVEEPATQPQSSRTARAGRESERSGDGSVEYSGL